MIFAVESSCDESALALFDPAKGLCGEWVHSQIDLHSQYGGIVPDLASREHLERFGPMLQKLAEETDLSGVSQVAVTVGPGLAGCLAMGMSTAKALALAWGKPLVGINHLRAHAWSPFINLHAEAPETFEKRLAALCPHLGLLVSGGNTLLFRLEADGRLEILAQTVDDAAGEALDKGAKLLGMPYPGGPLVEKRAVGGDPERFEFPRGMAEKADMRFSFSGLKTSLRYRIEKMEPNEVKAAMPDLCAGYQQAVIRQLGQKTGHILSDGGYKSLGLSGGVANNKALRAHLAELAEKNAIPLFAAEPRHTGDNAGMIAFAAYADPSGHLPAKTFDPSLPIGSTHDITS